VRVVSRTVEWIARRERAIVLLGLAVVIVLAWTYLLAGAGMEMATMDGMHMSDMSGDDHAGELWSGRSLVVFAMWSVMMAAMMLPSAAPAILLFAAVIRSRASTAPSASTGTFALGYVLVWTAFSVVATVAQWRLEQMALVSPAMRITDGFLAGLLLLAAGVYQLTPVKEACLRHCRSPIQFFTRWWRPGHAGALRLGLLHGGYCVGCCWALMGLLFVGGVMNLLWVGAVALFILVEKTAFLGTRFGRAASGIGLMVAGTIALAATW
jgi:predicted metal-binding membrane protein